MHDVRALAEAWLAVDPDEETRPELRTLLAAAERGTPARWTSASPAGCSSARPACGASSAPDRCG